VRFSVQINWGFFGFGPFFSTPHLFCGFSPFVFPFFFDEHPLNIKTLGALFLRLVPPFPLLSSFPLSDIISLFCIDPLSKKNCFFTLFFPFFFLLHSAKPSRPSFSLLSPLHACQINLGFLSFWFFFFDPPLFGGFSLCFLICLCDVHPFKIKSTVPIFCISFSPFYWCLWFRYRPTFRVFVSIFHSCFFPRF